MDKDDFHTRLLDHNRTSRLQIQLTHRTASVTEARSAERARLLPALTNACAFKNPTRTNCAVKADNLLEAMGTNPGWLANICVSISHPAT